MGSEAGGGDARRVFETEDVQGWEVGELGRGLEDAVVEVGEGGDGEVVEGWEGGEDDTQSRWFHRDFG